MKNYPTATTISVITCALLFLAGCATTPVQEDNPALASVKSILVLPVALPDTVNNDGPAALRQQLVSGSFILDSLLTDYFATVPGSRVISKSQEEGLAYQTAGGLYTQARHAGRQHDVDAVLLTTIHRYQPRNAPDYPEVRPASVSFEFKLLATSSDQILWTGAFDETQQPLSENILLFSKAASRGFRWITAEELAAEGIQERLNDCPYIQIMKGR